MLQFGFCGSTRPEVCQGAPEGPSPDEGRRASRSGQGSLSFGATRCWATVAGPCYLCSIRDWTGGWRQGARSTANSLDNRTFFKGVLGSMLCVHHTSLTQT